jgi:colanic acid/amylovoran biosynthesis glycosyltransferase
MKRLVYVTERFPAALEPFTTAEVVGLAARGLDVEVRTLRAQYREPDDPLPADRPIRDSPRGLPRALRPSRHPRVVWQAALRGAGLARSLEPAGDHVHAQFPLEAASVALFGARASGASFSFSGHSFHGAGLMAEKLAGASFVVVGSDFERELIAGSYGEGLRSKVHVRRLGVPERAARGAFEPGLVASVGALTGRKGHDVLIRAIAALADAGLDARLELIGDGPDQPGLKGLATALRVGDRVSFAGALPYEETLVRVAAAEVFALCCRETRTGDHDSLPVALMDAMSLGVPCVSSAAFGIPELIEDGVSGLLAPPGDVEAVAGRLAGILGAPGAQESLAAGGRHAVRERYDQERNLDSLAGLFRHLLG